MRGGNVYRRRGPKALPCIPSAKRPERSQEMEAVEIAQLYVDIVSAALPFTLVFFFGDFIVTTFLRAAFGGRLTFKD